MNLENQQLTYLLGERTKISLTKKLSVYRNEV